MKLKEALQNALELVGSEHIVNCWNEQVVNGDCSERDFIQSCFWGGDPINNENGYKSILSAFTILARHGLPQDCDPNHEVIVQGGEVLIVTIEERYIK